MANKSKGNEINRLIDRGRGGVGGEGEEEQERRVSLSTRSLEASAYDKVAAGRTSLIKFIESRDDATSRGPTHRAAHRASRARVNNVNLRLLRCTFDRFSN